MKLPIKANTKNIVITIVAIFMIVLIADNFIDLVKIGKEKKAKREWSEQKKKDLFERTQKEFSIQFPEFSEYPEIIKDYLNCTVDKVREKYSYDEYYEISLMSEGKKAQILLPIFQTCIDSFSKRIEPYKAEIKFKREVNECVKHARAKSSLDSLHAIEYCDCMLTYLKSKYGDIENLNVDSIKIIESEQIKKCLMEATKYNTAYNFSYPRGSDGFRWASFRPVPVNRD
jgi:hypothetical protein